MGIHAHGALQLEQCVCQCSTHSPCRVALHRRYACCSAPHGTWPLHPTTPPCPALPRPSPVVGDGSEAAQRRCHVPVVGRHAVEHAAGDEQQRSGGHEGGRGRRQHRHLSSGARSSWDGDGSRKHALCGLATCWRTTQAGGACPNSQTWPPAPGGKPHARLPHQRAQGGAVPDHQHAHAIPGSGQGGLGIRCRSCEAQNMSRVELRKLTRHVR